MHELDWIVGEVMRTLEEMGVAENTLVIFTSDNGGMFNATGQKTWTQGHRMNGDLLGFKFDAWEGGYRIPFIVNWPGKVEAGTVSDQLICNVDMLATFAALTGQELSTGQGEDSENMLEAFTGNGKRQIRKELLLAPLKNSHLAYRKDNWLYIGAQGAGGFSSGKHGAHAFGGPKAITFAGQENSDIEDGKIKAGAPPAQLYNLEEDPSQKYNLYDQNPDVVLEMKQRLNELKNLKPNNNDEQY